MRAIVWLLQLLGLSISVTLSKYVYIEEQKDWSGAYSYCREHHADLAPVSVESDMDRLRELAGDHSAYIWFGLLRNMTDKSKWWWSGGGEVKIFEWDDGQPNPGYSENFGIMINYRWHDAPHDMDIHFFCFDVHVVLEEKTWEEALEHCRENRKDLASISSDTEMMLIQSKMKNVGSQHVWVGLRFLAGQWLWVDGNTAGYEAWGQGGKPDCPGAGVACGALVSNGSVWEVHDCTEKRHFICY